MKTSVVNWSDGFFGLTFGSQLGSQLVKFNHLVANCAIYSTAVDLTAVINQLIAGGRNVDPEDVATLSPLITQTIRRFGDWHLDLTPPETAGDGRLALPGDRRRPRPTSPVAEADYRQQPGTGNRDQ